ncbi:hypothetical protein CEXT_162951 [Caerostris extrusa]|uniref:Uncharacterized protein n=1 Tax=Caerostris extrusa TaxID=172846 RepID=A0AAV4WUH4_CAEEX|nr:hypothetical protein CEXT_162951 [Caerostris extrusa]
MDMCVGSTLRFRHGYVIISLWIGAWTSFLDMNMKLNLDINDNVLSARLGNVIIKSRTHFGPACNLELQKNGSTRHQKALEEKEQARKQLHFIFVSLGEHIYRNKNIRCSALCGDDKYSLLLCSLSHRIKLTSVNENAD